MGTITSGAFRAGEVVTIKHAEDTSSISEVLDREPGRLLVMTWEFPDEPLSHVQIALAPAPDGTILTLTHEGLAEEAANYLPGWHTHLLYLEGAVTGQLRPMADFWSTYKELTYEELGQDQAGSGGPG